MSRTLVPEEPQVIAGEVASKRMLLLLFWLLGLTIHVNDDLQWKNQQRNHGPHPFSTRYAEAATVKG